MSCRSNPPAAARRAGSAVVDAAGRTDLAGPRLAAALVLERPLARPAGRVRIAIDPGDTVRVAAGDLVAVGAPLVERLRDPRLDEVPAAGSPDEGGEPVSGTRIPLPTTKGPSRRAGRGASMPANGGSAASDGSPTAAVDARANAEANAELLFRRRDRWLVVRGEQRDVGISPVEGTVVAVRPGRWIEIEAAGWRIPGTTVLGEPSAGPLAVAADGGLDGRPSGLDVGLAGTIAVVGGRVDAETISRARAMGLRGLVVGSLAGRVARAVAASEARQRAAAHPRPPFAVLALDGELRRPIPGPVRDLLGALVGRSVGIVADPPGLVVPDPLPAIAVDADRVVVRAGPWVGAEGRLVGLVGPWRFALGTHLLAARLATDAGDELVVPIGDLVRYGGAR